MALNKLTINIGNQSNDGTGDNIRNAFAKVNANFDTLFPVAAATVLPKFTNLSDGPAVLIPNAVLIANNSGTTVTQMTLVSGTGISMTYDRTRSQITVTNTGVVGTTGASTSTAAPSVFSSANAGLASFDSS